MKKTSQLFSPPYSSTSPQTPSSISNRTSSMRSILLSPDLNKEIEEDQKPKQKMESLFSQSPQKSPNSLASSKTLSHPTRTFKISKIFSLLQNFYTQNPKLFSFSNLIWLGIGFLFFFGLFYFFNPSTVCSQFRGEEEIKCLLEEHSKESKILENLQSQKSLAEQYFQEGETANCNSEKSSLTSEVEKLEETLYSVQKTYSKIQSEMNALLQKHSENFDNSFYSTRYSPLSSSNNSSISMFQFTAILWLIFGLGMELGLGPLLSYIMEHYKKDGILVARIGNGLSIGIDLFICFLGMKGLPSWTASLFLFRDSSLYLPLMELNSWLVSFLFIILGSRIASIWNCRNSFALNFFYNCQLCSHIGMIIFTFLFADWRCVGLFFLISYLYSVLFKLAQFSIRDFSIDIIRTAKDFFKTFHFIFFFLFFSSSFSLVSSLFILVNIGFFIRELFIEIKEHQNSLNDS